LSTPARRFVELTDPDGRTRWRLDAGFLTSNWTCLWGRGCQGIHDERRPELADGCCSSGVVLTGDDEARNIAALADTIPSERFQHKGSVTTVVGRHGPAGRWATAVVDGACVFLNRPGFAGGAGCALHLAAVDEDDDPVHWKPQTCSRLPIRAEERTSEDGTTEITVRAWQRHDWGPGGATMAWWCTEAPEAYVGDGPVVVRLESELRDLLGDAVYDAACAHLQPGARP